MLRRLLDTIAPTFKKGGRFERFYPLYEAIDTFFYANSGAEITEAAGLPCIVSLENRMACGFGVCLGCAVPRSDPEQGYHLVCRDGPVFESDALAWEGVP